MVEDRAKHPKRVAHRASRASGPSTEDIKADIARRAALPKEHPDYAIDDSDTTGTMGIRDNAALRKNASKLRGDMK
jgi:hypothetical protein